MRPCAQRGRAPWRQIGFSVEQARSRIETLSWVEHATVERRLPGSRREVEALARLFPASDVFLGGDASEPRLEELRATGKLREYSHLHFATHGQVSESSAYQTALVLNQVGNDGKEELGGVNDGFLRLPEVTFLKLNADAVVLSGSIRTGVGTCQETGPPGPVSSRSPGKAE